jgi:hypothetical protein
MPSGIFRLNSRNHQMKTLGMLFRALAYIIFAVATLSAQEKVAVLPPQGGKNVAEINKKIVRSAFLDYLSEPGSGFTAHNQNSIDMAVQEPSWRNSTLYDEKTARDIGKRLGVPLVCIIDLTSDEIEFLIECKLVRVDTGSAVSKSVVVPGISYEALKKGSETAVKRLMTDGAVVTDSAATAIATPATAPAVTHAPVDARTPDAPTAKPAAADHSTANKPAAPNTAATKTAPPPRLRAVQPPPTGKWSFAAYGCAPDLGAYLHQSGDELSDGDNFDIKKDLNLGSIVNRFWPTS